MNLIRITLAIVIIVGWSYVQLGPYSIYPPNLMKQAGIPVPYNNILNWYVNYAVAFSAAWLGVSAFLRQYRNH